MNIQDQGGNALPPQGDELFLRRILATSLNGIYSCDRASGQFDYVSDRFTEITGWTLTRLAESPEPAFIQLIHEEDRARTAAMQDSLDEAAGHDTIDFEFRLKTFSGDYITCEARETPLERGADGNVLRTMGSIVDVSRLARATEDCAEMERRFTMAMEGSSEGMWEWTLATGESYYSSAWKKMLGYEKDFSIGSREELNAMIHPADQDRLWDNFRSFLRGTGEKFDVQYRIRHRDGRWIDVMSRAAAQRDSDGRVTRLTGTHIDITERTLMEDQLRESEERFRTTFEQASVGLAHVATDGRWLRVNKTLCDILGYSREELVQKRFHDVSHPDDMDGSLLALSRMLRKEIYSNSLEKRYVRRDGSIVWVNISSALVWNDDGTPDHFVSVIENIDSRKQIEQQLDVVLRDLQRSNAELEDYAYVASHDLRAPLTAVESLAEWLEEDLAGTLTGRTAEYPALIRQRIGRMKVLLDDLLEYSRAGNYAGEVKDLDLQQLVDDLSAISRTRKVILKPGGTLPAIRTHAAPLEQIFRNLFSNAVKHHDKDTCTVEVKFETRENDYLFSLCDDGPGIPPEFRERVFGMFQTLRPRDQLEASGMGLALVKKLVERYRGEVWIDSNVPRGTVVSFSWPREPE